MEKEIEIEINGIKYVPKNSLKQAKKMDGMEYCIVRTYSAGVFAGYIKEKKDKEVVLMNSRRLWYWKGASSLSQLSVDGVKFPDECKFPCVVEKTILTEVIEIIPCTEKARECIDKVKVWEQ